jgi:hypothetical protein
VAVKSVMPAISGIPVFFFFALYKPFFLFSRDQGTPFGGVYILGL